MCLIFSAQHSSCTTQTHVRLLGFLSCGFHTPIHDPTVYILEDAGFPCPVCLTRQGFQITTAGIIPTPTTKMITSAVRTGRTIALYGIPPRAWKSAQGEDLAPSAEMVAKMKSGSRPSKQAKQEREGEAPPLTVAELQLFVYRGFGGGGKKQAEASCGPEAGNLHWAEAPTFVPAAGYSVRPVYTQPDTMYGA